MAREGCSSILFAKLMGEENAERMLGEEGWVPTGQEALDVGFVEDCVAHNELMTRAQELAEAWIASGKTRSFRGGVSGEELRTVNAKESIDVADSFLNTPFLRGQFKFLWSRKKRGPALMFWALMSTRSVWARLL